MYHSVNGTCVHTSILWLSLLLPLTYYKACGVHTALCHVHVLYQAVIFYVERSGYILTFSD